MSLVFLKPVVNYYTKQALELWPKLYLVLLKFKYRNHWFYKRIISDKTKIMIEGYPRCANSFAVLAFKRAQDIEVPIATHTHSHIHVLNAINIGTPCLVLIRNPSDAIISLKSLYIEATYDGKKTDPQIPIKYLIKWYIRFYKNLIKHKDKIVIADFNDIITDYTTVIKKINDKYNSNFKLFIHTENNVEKIFSISGTHLSPSEIRNKIKEEVRNEYYSDKNESYRRQAEDIYKKFIEK